MDVQPSSWDVALERAEALLHRGGVVVGMSYQAGLTGMTGLFFVLAVATWISGSFTWQAPVAVLGFGIVLASWLRARRHHWLEPLLSYPADSPLAMLNRDDRRAVRAQLRGKRPVSDRSVELVAALVQHEQDAARHLWPTLIGFLICLVGTNGGSRPLLLFQIGVVVLFVIIGVIAPRRWRRVRANVARAMTGSTDTSSMS